MRLFIALNLPVDVRERIHEAAAPLRATGANVAWTPAERLHLTLKFLGERPEREVAPLAAALERVAARHAAVPIAVEGIGAFPTPMRARVVWAGVAPDPRLELLHHDVETACEELGYPVEGRPFRPHVTLGRVRARIEPVEARRAFAAAGRTIEVREEIDVETVDLMRSEMGRGGSRYTRLAAAALRPA